MDMDDDASPESSEKTRSLPAQLDSSVIPEKHRKAWERLTAKRYKLQNVKQRGSTVSHDTDAIIRHHSVPIVTNTCLLFLSLSLSCTGTLVPV
jgi:hypothetical protein